MLRVGFLRLGFSTHLLCIPDEVGLGGADVGAGVSNEVAWVES